MKKSKAGRLTDCPLEKMFQEELIDKLRLTVWPYVANLGYEVVDMRIFKASGRLCLEFLVDKPAGGINLEECAALNVQLGAFLEKENILEASYLLEVSSPGTGRVLVTEKDFLRVYGRKVRVFLRESLNSELEIEGIAEGASDNFLSLNRDGAIVKIPMDKINKAKQVIE